MFLLVLKSALKIYMYMPLRLVQPVRKFAVYMYILSSTANASFSFSSHPLNWPITYGPTPEIAINFEYPKIAWSRRSAFSVTLSRG